MASYYDKLRCAASQSRTPIAAKLEGIFEAIDDGELLKALKGKVHRGCQGYSVKALWHSYLAGYVLNIPTVASLIRRLQSDSALCVACGLNPAAIPSEATYSRFISKLTSHEYLVEAVFQQAVVKLKEQLPDFGKIVAVDSTDIAAWSQSRRPSDPDARWGKKKDKHGHDKWFFGYKAHVLSDATYELPIQLHVTPANEADSKYLPVLLNKNGVHPVYLLADKGYDTAENYRLTHDDIGAFPIIALNTRGKGRGRGGPVHHKLTQQTVRGRELRVNPGIERDSSKWEALYTKRTAAERLFSRMKEFRRLGSLHQKGLPKVTLHCYLSTLTIVASAVAAIYCQQPLRKVA